MNPGTWHSLSQTSRPQGSRFRDSTKGGGYLGLWRVRGAVYWDAHSLSLEMILYESFITTGLNLPSRRPVKAVSPRQALHMEWALSGNWVPSCGYLRKFTSSFPFSKYWIVSWAFPPSSLCTHRPFGGWGVVSLLRTKRVLGSYDWISRHETLI